MKPAFVVSMTHGTSSSSRSASKPATNQPKGSVTARKRARVTDLRRVSELTRKYRANIGDNDESLLVGGANTTGGNSTNKRKFKPLSTKTMTEVLRQPAFSPAIRFSRFPGSWKEAVVQVEEAVSCSVEAGHDRVRVDVRTPELLADAYSMGSAYGDSRSTHSRRIALLVESANQILKRVFTPDLRARKAANRYHMLLKPTRAAVFFNSKSDARIGRKRLSAEMSEFVDVRVLGEMEEKIAQDTNVFIVIAPSNKQGNPSHIENVELVHYCNWTTPKLIIMVNPDLVALTRYSSFDNEPRQPCFLTDYVPSYYIDPAAFPTKSATGAVLRCYPRKWEMYLLKVHNDMGFRLVAEQGNQPTKEKLLIEFSSRIEKEVGRKASL